MMVRVGGRRSYRSRYLFVRSRLIYSDVVPLELISNADS
jgi:hypothetical protein